MAYTGTFTLQDYNDAGASGLNTAVAILYKRSAASPAKPTTTTTFTFATGAMTGQDNDWTQAIPASNGNPLWVIQAVASAIAPAASDTIPYTEWSSPVKIVENGAAGTPGYNSAVLYLYQRKSSAPATTDIIDPITYTFSTKAITNYPTSTGAWTTTIPAGTDPLYVIVATASSNTSTDTIARSEWVTPRILAQNGVDGTPAQYVIVNGEQAFKYLTGSSTPVSSSITLTANLFGGLTTYDWEYWNGAWTNLSGTQNTQNYSLAYNNAAWGTATSLRIRCLSGSAYDEITIVKLYDGAAGTNGDDGVGIASAVVTYQNDTDGTSAPTGTWLSSPPSPVKGQYLWTRTITSYTDSSSITTYSVAYNATDGQNGTDGKGISSTVVSYQLSTSGTVIPTSTWEASPPTPIKGRYLWTRTVINYTTGSPSTAYSTSYYATDGQKGDKGDTGNTGASGQDAITILLSNESHTFAGNISNALAGSTVVSIIAYKGATRVTSAIGTITGRVNGLTTSIAGNDTTSNTFTVSATTALVTANGVLTIPITVDGKSFTKNFSFAVSFKGATGDTGSTGDSGADAKVITLTASAQIFTKPKTGSVTPSTITVTGTTQNTTIATWQYSTNGGAFTTTLPTGVTRSGNVVTITGTTMNVKTIAVKAFNGVIQDTVTIAKVEDGVDGNTGATGRGVSSIVEEFYLSTSKTTQTGGDWSTTMPTWSPGMYVWTRSKITYTSGSPATETTTPLVSSEWEAVNEIPEYIASRGENLLTNGTGLLGTNYNFPGYTFDASEAYGAGGSFTDTISATRTTTEFMPVNPDDTYRLTMYAKQLKATPESSLTKHYSFVNMYDVDKNSIAATNIMWITGTHTTLAQDLKPGDTIVYLTSAANWKNNAGTSTHMRTIIFWKYTNSGGYEYPIGTYSRYKAAADLWADGSVNYVNNTITLRSAWNYNNPKDAQGYWRAGHPLSNGSSGGYYVYLPLVNTQVPEIWTRYSGTLSGTDLLGQNTSGKFRPGTAYVKIGWLNHYAAGQTTSTEATNNKIYYSNISFAKDTNAVSTADVEYSVATSPTTYNGTSWSTSAPALSQGQYLWSRTKVTYMDGTINYKPSSSGTNISGVLNGRGIVSITEQYYLSTSKTAQTGGNWDTTAPVWSTGKYLWTRSDVRYSDAPSTPVYVGLLVDSSWEAVNEIQIGGRNLVVRYGELANSQIGEDGAIIAVSGTAVMVDFIPVVPGEVLTFTMKQSSNVDGGFWRWRWFNAEQEYIARTANSSKEFQWVVPAEAYFIQVSYPMDAYPKLEKGNIATDWTPAPEDVQAGIDKSVKSTDVEYYLSTSATSLAGGSWSTTAPTWVDGKYMWSRTKVTLNNGTTSYTPSATGTCIAGAKGATGSSGTNGTNGKTYIGVINAGVRSITFNAAGSNPTPAQTAFSCQLYENGSLVTPGTYAWSATGHLSGTSTASTFTPVCAGTFNASNNDTVSLTLVYSGQTIKITIPISATRIGATGNTGSAGINTATIFLYQRSASAPVVTDIANPITYTFSSKAITSYPTSTGSWRTTIPTGTDPIYVITAVASASTTTDTIARSEWGTPVVLSQNGEDGGEIPQQTDPPTPLVLGMLWLDTNSTPAILRRCISTSATEFSEIWEALNPSYDEMVEAINNIDTQLSNEAISYTPKDKMYILYQWRTTEVAYQNILARINSSSFKSVIIGSDGTLQDALTALTTIRNALIVNLDLLDILTSTGAEDIVGLSETTIFTNNNYVATFASLHSQMEKIQKMFVDLPSQMLKLEEESLVIDRTKLVNIDGSVLVNGSVIAEKINIKGLSVTDESGAITLTISETGDIVMKGIVYASGGEFSGKVTATSGTFSGMVNADGGVFTSAITLNGYLDTGDSGITGVLTDTVRLWAGSTYENRNVAPFRVSNLGYLYAEAAEITGTINATGGTFTNSIALTGYLTVGSGSQLAGINGAGSSDTDVRFWAGDTYENSGSAKFRVLQNGDLYAENGYFSGTIESSGALNGALTAGNIYIKNNNNWSSTTDLATGNGWSFAIFPDDISDEPTYNSYSYLAIEEGIFQQNYNTTFISRPVANLDTTTVADMYAQINSSVQGIISKNIYSFDSSEKTVSKIVGGSFRLFYEDIPTLTSAPNAANEKLRISATSEGSVVLSNKIFFLGTGSTYENDPIAFANPTIGFGTKIPRIDNSVTINGGLAILDQLGFYEIAISYVNPAGKTISSSSAKLIAKNTDNGISIDFNM